MKKCYKRRLHRIIIEVETWFLFNKPEENWEIKYGSPTRANNLQLQTATMKVLCAIAFNCNVVVDHIHNKKGRMCYKRRFILFNILY